MGPGIPAFARNDFLFVMPEIACRASTHSVMPEITCRASMFLFFLDSRQKIAGMTEGALDSRQICPRDFLSGKIAGMTDGALDSGFHRNDE